MQQLQNDALFSICLNSRAKTLSIKNMKEMEFKVKTEMDGVSLVPFSLVPLLTTFVIFIVLRY